MQGLPAGRPLALDELQRYVADMEKTRGFSDCSMVEQVLRLAEETGELCKAIRNATGLSIDPVSATGSIANECADVLIFLISIANRAGFDLSDALRDKEEINQTRVWCKAGA
jgi:NTP pyrophosphatase (non-canonical NTP hydrolase)